MKRLLVLLIIAISLMVFAGCASIFTNERAVSINDVIKMSNAGIGDEIIKSQIDMTRSTYKLTSDDMLLLKKEGVSEDVIKFMVESDELSYYGGFSRYDHFFDYYDVYSFPYFTGSYYYHPFVPLREPGLVGDFYRYYPIYNQGNGRMYNENYNNSEIRGNSRRPDMERKSGDDNDSRDSK